MRRSHSAAERLGRALGMTIAVGLAALVLSVLAAALLWIWDATL
ncbi:Uncharacterised protein [Actinomyces bovis]|uniref:Uncharacterized protein n=1 Tax=Actinomyces bovis TaxID=1658 RepID=A0ABY1VQ63_9ACTO|nr:hypothetical protein [Actinomyces bovis]SPT53781.1 Uncharacterised protein [Actinomyces bovis]VEG53131.1 Uncharacterised protein [Actinomyces israelii]